MRWNDDAQAAVNKAPFFVRGMIRKRVEEHVSRLGRDLITVDDVNELKAKAMKDGEAPGAREEDKSETYYGGMTAQQIEKIVENTRTEVLSKSRFYEVKVCGGAFGCPRALYDVRALAERMIEIIEQSDVPEAVQRRTKGPILRHNKLSVSISGCPNSCSQPQIADFGIQGRVRPAVGPGECDGCGACVAICKEDAVTIPNNQPTFDFSKCINCGDCAAVCPTQAIIRDEQGFSVLIGGKLGRHPQLAKTLHDFTSEEAVLDSLRGVCDLFANRIEEEERFANLVDRLGVEEIMGRCRVSGVGRKSGLQISTVES